MYGLDAPCEPYGEETSDICRRMWGSRGKPDGWTCGPRFGYD